MHTAQKSKSKLKFVMLDKNEHALATRRFSKFCNKEDLAEKAQVIELTIPVEKCHWGTLYNFNPTAFFVNHDRFWGRRPDGVAVNDALQTVCVSEFKESTDRDVVFLEEKEAEANEQHKSNISAFRQLLRNGNFSRLKLWWVTADRLLKASCTPSSKSLMYKKERRTNSSQIM